MTVATKDKTGIEGIEPEGKAGNYLNLLQGLSKQVTEGEGRPGEWFNTLTGEAKKEVEVIAVGYQWKTILYKTDEDGNPIEGDKGPEYFATVTDPQDERLEGRRYYNDKDNDLKLNAVKIHVWKFVVPGTSDVLEVGFKKSNLKRHDDVLRIIKASGEHMSKVVLKLSSKKAEKGPHMVAVVEKARDAKEDEAKLAFDVWNGDSEGDIPF